MRGQHWINVFDEDVSLWVEHLDVHDWHEADGFYKDSLVVFLFEAFLCLGVVSEVNKSIVLISLLLLVKRMIDIDDVVGMKERVQHIRGDILAKIADV